MAYVTWGPTLLLLFSHELASSSPWSEDRLQSHFVFFFSFDHRPFYYVCTVPSHSPYPDVTQIQGNQAGSSPPSPLRYAPSFLLREDSSYFFPRRLASNGAYPRCQALSAVHFFDYNLLQINSKARPTRVSDPKTNSSRIRGQPLDSGVEENPRKKLKQKNILPCENIA